MCCAPERSGRAFTCRAGDGRWREIASFRRAIGKEEGAGSPLLYLKRTALVPREEGGRRQKLARPMVKKKRERSRDLPSEQRGTSIAFGIGMRNDLIEGSGLKEGLRRRRERDELAENRRGRFAAHRRAAPHHPGWHLRGKNPSRDYSVHHRTQDARGGKGVYDL